jgi:hypothetical protein
MAQSARSARLAGCGPKDLSHPLRFQSSLSQDKGDKMIGALLPKNEASVKTRRNANASGSMAHCQSIDSGALFLITDFNLGMPAFSAQRELMVLSRDEIIENYKVLDLPLPHKFFAG